MLVLLGLSFSLAFSQDDVMLLEDDAFGVRERPPVEFPHAKHAELITSCVRCHHDFDAYGNNEGSEGQKCGECHGKAASAKNRVDLGKAFHLQCKGCHEDLTANGKKSGPVMCGSCHKRPAAK